MDFNKEIFISRMHGANILKKTYFVFKNFFFPENRGVCEIMWENTVQPERPQMFEFRSGRLCPDHSADRINL